MNRNLRLVAVLLLAMALVARSPVLAAAAFILAGSTYATGWWTTRAERGLRVRQNVAETVGFGEQTTVTIEVANRSLLPIPWVQVVDSVPLALRLGLPQRHAFALGAGARREFTYRVLGSRRGFYHIGPLRLLTGDVLGLHTRQLNAPRVEITVLPRVLPLPRLGLPAQLVWGPLRANVRRSEDPARPAGVRPYQASDGIRRLDWKSTARQGELLVRRAEPSVTPETTLALAFGRHDFPPRILQDCLERGAVAAASLGVALLQRKLPVALVSNGQDPKNPESDVVLAHGKGESHRQLLLHLIGRLQTSDQRLLWDLLARQPLPWGGTVALVIADLDVEHIPHAAALRRRGQHLVALLLEPTAGGLALAHGQGIPAWPVNREGVPLAEQTG